MYLQKYKGLALLALFTSTVSATTIDIRSAKDLGNGHEKYPADNAIDGDPSWASRWAASGTPVNLVLNLYSNETVNEVGIAWGRGDERTYDFEIFYRADAATWTSVYQGTSSGTTEGIEIYDIGDVYADQIRVQTYSNSIGTQWTDIIEAEIYANSDENNNVNDDVDKTVVIQKKNTVFSIDGNNGSIESQRLYLWATNTNNINQQWVEISEGNNYYRYQKAETNLCFDGGEGAVKRQAVTLESCDSENENQHWLKVTLDNGTFRLEKRGTDFSIDGNKSAENEQEIYLWESSDTNVNQQWQLLADDESTGNVDGTVNALEDYSQYSTAAQYQDAYPDQPTKPGANWPTFSWDKIPRWLAFRNNNEMSDEDVVGIAENYQVAMLEKANNQGKSSVEEGTKDIAARLKEVNPEITTLFYWNTNINYGGYIANEKYNDNVWDWSTHETDENGEEAVYLFKDLYYWYDHSAEGMRNWWIDTALGMATDPNIDGVFLDKVLGNEGAYFDETGKPVTDYIDMMSSLYAQLPADKLLIGNTLRNERSGGNREHMHYMDGSYLERWDFRNRDVSPIQTETEAMHASIQLMREALSKGKMINFQTGPGSSPSVTEPTSDSESVMKAYYQEALQFPLAVFLIVVEENAYFSFQGTVAARLDEWMWNTSWMEEFSKPLGEPLSDPVREGDVYTRSFEHVDVTVDVEAKTASIVWK